MATAPEAPEGGGPPPKKSKKLLIIIGAALLVVLLGGGGAFWYVKKQQAAAAEDGGDEPTHSAKAGHGAPPAYLAMDNMVVNLADPGGDRVAQIGITLVVADSHASDTVKAYLPTIRSGVLMLVAKKTAVELLTPEGKETLAREILHEALLPFGGGDEEAPAAASKKSKKSAESELPVKAVLFSSFIVQ